MEREPIFVAALGASTPLGRDAWSSAAAVRAGISGFSEHPCMLDSAGEPMRVAIAPWLDPGLRCAERLEALLCPAIDQALTPLLEGERQPLRIALSLGLPPARPGLPEDLQAWLAGALRERYQKFFSAVAVFPNGHAAGLLALDAAAKKLEQGVFDACVVAGVDSYMD
ncbi:MAG TPA: hypothetical protein VLJ19_15950, partial [Variovorax sp.]|nr:hypothetical protein [Variovorax sp.]